MSSHLDVALRAALASHHVRGRGRGGHHPARYRPDPPGRPGHPLIYLDILGNLNFVYLKIGLTLQALLGGKYNQFPRLFVSGLGKTHTMFGGEGAEGIIPPSIAQILQAVQVAEIVKSFVHFSLDNPRPEA